MDSLQLLEQGISLILAAPVTSGVLVVIGAVVAWLIANSFAERRLSALQSQFEARDEKKVLIEERLAAVMRNEDMLKTQVSALQEYFHIVESQVLHEGRVPALIAATGSTASIITNIALTTEALAGSLTVLRLGVGRQHQPAPVRPAAPAADRAAAHPSAGHRGGRLADAAALTRMSGRTCRRFGAGRPGAVRRFGPRTPGVRPLHRHRK